MLLQMRNKCILRKVIILGPIFVIILSLMSCSTKFTKDTSKSYNELLFLDNKGILIVKTYNNEKLSKINTIYLGSKILHGYQTYLNDTLIEQIYFDSSRVSFKRNLYKGMVDYYSYVNCEYVYIGSRRYSENSISKDNLILYDTKFKWHVNDYIPFKFKKMKGKNYLSFSKNYSSKCYFFDKNIFLPLDSNFSLPIVFTKGGLFNVIGMFINDIDHHKKYIYFYHPCYIEDENSKLTKKFKNDISYLFYEAW